MKNILKYLLLVTLSITLFDCSNDKTELITPRELGESHIGIIKKVNLNTLNKKGLLKEAIKKQYGSLDNIMILITEKNENIESNTRIKHLLKEQVPIIIKGDKALIKSYNDIIYLVPKEQKHISVLVYSINGSLHVDYYDSNNTKESLIMQDQIENVMIKLSDNRQKKQKNKTSEENISFDQVVITRSIKANDYIEDENYKTEIGMRLHAILDVGGVKLGNTTLLSENKLLLNIFLTTTDGITAKAKFKRSTNGNHEILNVLEEIKLEISMTDINENFDFETETFYPSQMISETSGSEVTHTEGWSQGETYTVNIGYPFTMGASGSTKKSRNLSKTYSYYSPAYIITPVSNNQPSNDRLGRIWKYSLHNLPGLNSEYQNTPLSLCRNTSSGTSANPFYPLTSYPLYIRGTSSTPASGVIYSTNYESAKNKNGIVSISGKVNLTIGDVTKIKYIWDYDSNQYVCSGRSMNKWPPKKGYNKADASFDLDIGAFLSQGR